MTIAGTAAHIRPYFAMQELSQASLTQLTVNDATFRRVQARPNQNGGRSARLSTPSGELLPFGINQARWCAGQQLCAARCGGFNQALLYCRGILRRSTLHFTSGRRTAKGAPLWTQNPPPPKQPESLSATRR
jgi:hypothetical protein